MTLAAIVHYQTPGLVEEAAESFRKVYPDVPLWLVDNGSVDGSAATVKNLAKSLGQSTRFLGLEKNIYHGPAMDLVLQQAKSEYVFFLDSDTVTVRAGFLELMREALENSPPALAAGSIVTVDRRGFSAPKGIRVPESAYMMVRRSVYMELPPFVHHGLPVLGTCTEADRRGWPVLDVPVEDYIEHIGRGTAARFGYGLGIRSRIDYLLHRLGL